MPNQFDPVLHSGPRITILSRMVIRQRMRFSALQKSTLLTPGNLSAHLDVLAEAGYVRLQVSDGVQRRKVVHVTPEGDAAYRAYLAQVKAILEELQSKLPAPST